MEEEQQQHMVVKDGVEVAMDNILYEQVPPTKMPERPFACDTCGETFQEEGSLLEHSLLHNTDEEALSYACDQCEHKFAKEILLKAHQRVHAMLQKIEKNGGNLPTITPRANANTQPFKCKECDKGFVRIGLLTKHMANDHEELLAFPCDLCQARFSQPILLEAHKRIHVMVVEAKSNSSKIGGGGGKSKSKRSSKKNDIRFNP